MPIDGERYALLTFSHGKNKINLSRKVYDHRLTPFGIKVWVPENLIVQSIHCGEGVSLVGLLGESTI